MDIDTPWPLLGGLSPARFMRRHWQKAPLLVRQAWPGVQPPIDREALFALATAEGVESRVVWREPGLRGAKAWRLQRAPFTAEALPPVTQPKWTLLVQGLDLHVEAAHRMLRRFRFVPDARLDDLMLSWASPGGGVGPHVDSYDVFLLQVQGRRRWRVAPPSDSGFVPDVPLKLLRRFEPTLEWVLEPGDMLYLPPGWGHDGEAVGGDCMTCSVGFRAPARDELARELLQRLADDTEGDDTLYRDPRQPATASPGALPDGLLDFAADAVRRRLADRHWLARTLGEILSEPKPDVVFEGPGAPAGAGGVRLSPRTRMLHDARHVFINGEAFEAGGRDATLMRRLADRRALVAADCARLSPGARALLEDWVRYGWAEGLGPDGEGA